MKDVLLIDKHFLLLLTELRGVAVYIYFSTKKQTISGVLRCELGIQYYVLAVVIALAQWQDFSHADNGFIMNRALRWAGQGRIYLY